MTNSRRNNDSCWFTSRCFKFPRSSIITCRVALSSIFLLCIHILFSDVPRSTLTMGPLIDSWAVGMTMITSLKKWSIGYSSLPLCIIRIPRVDVDTSHIASIRRLGKQKIRVLIQTVLPDPQSLASYSSEPKKETQEHSSYSRYDSDHYFRLISSGAQISMLPPSYFRQKTAGKEYKRINTRNPRYLHARSFFFYYNCCFISSSLARRAAVR